MSMSGQRMLELERARREELRLGQVRGECHATEAECAAAIGERRDLAIQQLSAIGLQAVMTELAAARDQIAATPDAALVALGGVRQHLHEVIAAAEGKAKAWSDAQAAAVVAARIAAAAAASAGLASDGLGGDVAGSRNRAHAAVQLAERGDLAGAAAAVAAAVVETEKLRTDALDERVRREVVRGLLASLKDMGFVVAGPQLRTGRVVLEGRLASGRKARFEVSVDGKMEFDLDGYEGRECAKDLEKVETVLRDRFGVKLGPPQVVWKNPDRLSAGARDLPSGGTAVNTRKGR